MKQKHLENFIKTSDAETAQKLRNLGYTELTEPHSSTFCFINNGKVAFDENETHCVYTNILCL